MSIEQPFPLGAADVVDVSWDWAARLTPLADSISTFTVSPGPNMAIATPAPSRTGAVVTAWIKWAVPPGSQTTSYVECTISTVGGRTFTWRILTISPYQDATGGVATTTLEALRDKFRARLGMSSQILLAQDNLNSFLEDGQSQLWEQFDWPHLIHLGVITTNASAPDPYRYDYPSNCDPRRILSNQVAVADNTVYTTLREGIDWGHRSQPTLTGLPRRFERFELFEVWPKPDRAYPITFKYVRNLGRFSQDRDLCDLDPGLILLHALFNAKSHYRQPDAQVYANQLQARLAQIKAGAISKRSYSRTPEYDPPPLPRQV